MKKQSFLKGAATIAVGGFIAKLIGALYRIPLTNIIGGYGMGLYQMVYPFYCLLLTISATGTLPPSPKWWRKSTRGAYPPNPFSKVPLSSFSRSARWERC